MELCSTCLSVVECGVSSHTSPWTVPFRHKSIRQRQPSLISSAFGTSNLAFGIEKDINPISSDKELISMVGFVDLVRSNPF